MRARAHKLEGVQLQLEVVQLFEGAMHLLAGLPDAYLALPPGRRHNGTSWMWPRSTRKTKSVVPGPEAGLTRTGAGSATQEIGV